MALRFPMVMVPVLSNSNVSMSPAVSTALPDLVITLARKCPIHACNTNSGKQAANGGRNQANKQGNKSGNSDRRIGIIA